ncbi:MAG: radical SAM protein, partial [Desulfobacteraceae bacterium]
MNTEKNEDQIISQRAIGQLINQLSSKKIVIYPAGKLGQQLQKTLSEYDIDIDFFVDRAYERLKSINGIVVNSPDTLSELDSRFQVIISVNWDTQFEHLKQVVLEKNPELQIHDGWILNQKLKMPICLLRTKENKAIDIFECENCGFERHHCQVASECLKEMGNHADFENDSRSKSFDWFGCIVSQKCTLRCEHCCEQVHLLKDKDFAPIESILADVKQIADASYFLNFVELIGGEPFLHPQIEDLVEGLLEIENIGYIKSFTNGTIVPSDRLCEIINNPRFMLQVSNYEKVTSGQLFNNIIATKKKLNEHDIPFIFTNTSEWLDIKDFKKHD